MAATKHARNVFRAPAAPSEAATAEFARVVRERHRGTFVSRGGEQSARQGEPIRWAWPAGVAHRRASSDLAKTLAEIMAERHPGTRWLPVERDDRSVHEVAAGKVVRLFSRPEDQHPL